jgi:hypothetical protein
VPYNPAPLAFLIWYVMLLLVTEWVGRLGGIVRVVVGIAALVAVCCALAWDRFGDLDPGGFAQVASLFAVSVGVNAALGASYLMHRRLHRYSLPPALTGAAVLVTTAVSALMGVVVGTILIVLIGFGWCGANCR